MTKSPVSYVNIGLLLSISILLVILIYKPADSPVEQPVQLSSISTDNINKVVLSHKGTEHILLKRTANAEPWQLELPDMVITANESKVKKIIELANQQIVRSLDTNILVNDKDNRFGLQPPHWKFRFNDLLINFGNTDPIDNLRYVSINNRIHLIHDRFSQFMFDSPHSFASLSLLPGKHKIRSIKFSSKKESLLINETQTGWSVESNFQNQHNVRNLPEYIANWQNAKANQVDRISDKMLQSINTDTTVSINFSGKIAPLSFVITATGDERFFLINSDTQLIYAIDDKLADQLNISNLVNVQPSPTERQLNLN